MESSKKPPLVEAIFELRWGETSPGNFTYTEEDRTIFVPKFSVAAGIKGFKEIESINSMPGTNTMPFPMLVSYRFRRASNTWPCIQVGLGIFTVNQVAHDYSWKTFKESIKSGLELFNQTEENKLSKVKDTAKLRLIYQDVLDVDDTLTVEEYFKKNLNINVNLPISDKNDCFSTLENMSLSFSFKTLKPEGVVVVNIARVFADMKPAYLIETVVESSVKNLNAADVDSLMNWVESSHLVQKFSYKTLMSGE